METFFIRDRHNPNWGWICYMGADRTITPIEYVRRKR